MSIVWTKHFFELFTPLCAVFHFWCCSGTKNCFWHKSQVYERFFKWIYSSWNEIAGLFTKAAFKTHIHYSSSPFSKSANHSRFLNICFWCIGASTFLSYHQSLSIRRESQTYGTCFWYVVSLEVQIFMENPLHRRLGDPTIFKMAAKADSLNNK